MTTEQFHITLQQGEDYKTEFKRNVTTDLSREWVAFANASGGRIFLGVKDDGTIAGIEITNELKSQVQSMASACDPPVAIALNKVKNTLIITVVEGVEKPYRSTNGFYLRVGANAQKMGTRQIISFVQHEGRVKFDELRHEKFEFEGDFDPEKLNHFIRLANISNSIPTIDLLQNLNVLHFEKDKPVFNNAGVLFFSKHPNKLIPQSSVICALFKGTERVNILDRQEYTGDVISNIESVILYLKQHLKTRYVIEQLKREERLELPEVALREAVVNALAHRDYFEKGTHVTIELFDDRVDIYNFGGLPNGLSEKDFGKRSLPRNPILASLLHRVGYIERMGTGISRIRKAMDKASLVHPEFGFDGFFSLSFKRISSEKSSEKILGLIREDSKITIQDLAKKIGISTRAIEKMLSVLKKEDKLTRVGGDKGGVWKVIQNIKELTATKGSEKSSEKDSEKSSEKILNLIGADSKITIQDLAQEVGISTRAIENSIALLKQKGKLERIGGAKGGHWRRTNS